MNFDVVALPIIWLMGEEVTIYVGTYGDPGKSFRINFSKLQIWLRYNPICWQRGCCTA